MGTFNSWRFTFSLVELIERFRRSLWRRVRKIKVPLKELQVTLAGDRSIHSWFWVWSIPLTESWWNSLVSRVVRRIFAVFPASQTDALCAGTVWDEKDRHAASLWGSRGQLTVSRHLPPCGQCRPLRGRGCRGSGCWTSGGSPHRCGRN